MNSARFIVSTVFQGRRQTQTWDTRTPLMLGRTKNGPQWVIEQMASGKLRIRNLAQLEGEVANAHSHTLTQDQTKRGVQVKFKRKELELGVEIKAVEEIHPKIYRLKHGGDLKDGFQVFQAVGSWRTEATTARGHYFAEFRGEPTFEIFVKNGQAVVIPKHKDLEIDINGAKQAIGSMAEVLVPESEFFHSILKVGTCRWYFAPVARALPDPLFDKAPPSDTHELKKWAGMAAMALLVILGAPFLMPKPVEEEVIPPQVVKVLIKKAPKAAQKLEIPGEKKKTEERPLAQSPDAPKEQPKTKELIVPKGGSSSPKVAKQVPTRVKKVQNLYEGIMRGGLAKVLDSKALLDSTKLGAGGTIKGGAGSIAGALAGVNLDVNTVGTGDTKIAGFGGTGAAGVRGPAQIGYADGVKGVGGGTGGSRVSLGLADADVEEGLTKEEVGRVIHAHMKEVRYCYESTMVRSSRVDGKINLDFIINGRGIVATAKTGQSSIPDRALGECIARHLKTWQFPLPKGGVNVNVSYPFIFKTLNGT